MTEKEIRDRLERYKKWRRDRSQKNYTGPPFANHDADWLIGELERQLDRNCKFVKTMRPVRYAIANTDPEIEDSRVVHVGKLLGKNQYAYLELSHLRRLVEISEEVKDE